MTSQAIDAAGGVLVVGDLHLDLADPAGADAFAAWCASLSGARRLVVLGDLVDAWAGPAHAQLPAARRMLRAFAELRGRGIEPHLVHGNRDFLLDREFGALHGLAVHEEELLVECGAGRVLLVHGDLECTRDRGYQRLRRLLRSAAVRRLARVLPSWAALYAARRLRRASRDAVARKIPEDKSIQRDAVAARARRSCVQAVVCGHAHAHRDERAGDARWVVVDAFGGAHDMVRLDERGLAVQASGAR